MQLISISDNLTSLLVYIITDGDEAVGCERTDEEISCEAAVEVI